MEKHDKFPEKWWFLFTKNPAESTMGSMNIRKSLSPFTCCVLSFDLGYGMYDVFTGIRGKVFNILFSIGEDGIGTYGMASLCFLQWGNATM